MSSARGSCLAKASDASTRRGDQVGERRRQLGADARETRPMTKEKVEATARACELNAGRMSRRELDRWYKANVGFRLTEGRRGLRVEEMRAAVAASMFYKKMPAGVDTPRAEEVEQEMTKRIRAGVRRDALATAPVMSAAQVAVWGKGASPGRRKSRRGRQAPPRRCTSAPETVL